MLLPPLPLPPLLLLLLLLLMLLLPPLPLLLLPVSYYNCYDIRNDRPHAGGEPY
jgi:hypothetical protein